MNRFVALLVLLAACTKADGGNVPSSAPGTLTVIGPVGFAPMDTLTYTLSWGAASRATSYRVTVAATATNGSWSGLPSVTPVLTGTAITYTTSAVPWDSATFTATVETVDRIGPTGKTSSASWKIQHRAGAPGPITVDSTKAVGTLVRPDSIKLVLGGNRVACAFKQFGNGAISQFTADRSMCDSVYTRTIPAVARALVTPAMQAHTDSLALTCVAWSTSGPAAVGLAPRASCSAAVVVTGLQVTLRSPVDQMPFRNISWTDDLSPVLFVSPTGRATCLRSGVGYVEAVADNGVVGRAMVVCNGPLPSFLAALR